MMFHILGHTFVSLWTDLMNKVNYGKKKKGKAISVTGRGGP
jgi:hypothetical protein